MLEKAVIISKEVAPKKISALYQKINFSENAVEEFMKQLKPKFPIRHKEFNDFFKNLGDKIAQG
jgi:predicted nucleic acid-binding protein